MEGTLTQFNLFYAEVSYNPIGKGITFVQKHSVLLTGKRFTY